MTQASLGLPPHLLPRPKAPPTSSSTTSLHALASSSTPQLSRASSRNRQDSPLLPPSIPVTGTSDKATTALIRRVLCPHAHGAPNDLQPIDELLPPLTSSNDVDLQLYAIIAVIVKEFVYSWYAKITPDQGFVEDVVRISAHCTRALEQRIRSTDIENLVFNELPQLLEGHVHAYRLSQQSLNPNSPSTSVDPRSVYHTLVPHPAFSPPPDEKNPSTIEEQSQNEGAYRQLLVHGALAVLLPTEDLGNACLRTLVADVAGEMILGQGIGGKACEGWFIWDGITKTVATIKARVEPKATGPEIEADTRTRLEKFGLLSGRDDTTDQRRKHARSSPISRAFWRILQYGYLAVLATRFVFVSLLAASSSTSRRPLTTTEPHITGDEHGVTESTTATAWTPPLLTFRIFPLISLLLHLAERAPWLSGSLSLMQHHLTRRPGRLGATDGLLDK
ncbi:hypothetical protein MMC19_006760 [Ptychographa xylographoides]|nr:hypothetical protein [Ptychographa xylographoides]